MNEWAQEKELHTGESVVGDYRRQLQPGLPGLANFNLKYNLFF